ncbi:hypothetical protein PR048_015409 [Dryococelus australis]|uniref:Uncharacterized protein n=1 Tax=Dryococelus australis TaxID=614101 RepID=A0ABQ9HH13_9NEOP|nr:hypothetical protein PR048_015409 [Dryococelus australis]
MATKARVQPTLKSLISQTSPFRPGDPNAKSITKHIGRMLCLDNQPLSIVEGRGLMEFVKFIEPSYLMPSRKHFSGKVIPDMYYKCKEKVKLSWKKQTCKELKNAQSVLNVNQHKVVQDELTRWNSIYHMFERLLEQKQAVTLAATKLNLPAELSASEIIPIANSTIKELQKPAPLGSGVQGIKNDLIYSVSLRYVAVEQEILFATGTLIDPRLKSHPVMSNAHTKDTAAPAEAHGMWEFYSKIMNDAMCESQATSIRAETQTYLQEPVLPPSTNIFHYLKENHKFPNIKRLTKKYFRIHH